MILNSIGLSRRDVGIITLLFVTSRAVYAVLGLTFDATTFPGYMQFIDEQLLSTRLFESLWYYHANPPLLNLLAGIGVKLFGGHADSFFAIVFHVLGLLLAASVYVLTWRLSASRLAAAIATALLVFSPSFVLYENWFMYTFPAVALLTMSAVALHQYLQTQRTAWCATFFGLLAVLLLTRSLFHLAWMVLIAILLTVLRYKRRRQVLLAAVVPVLLVGAWYGKNYYYFSMFSSSSWFGLGLSNISTLIVPRETLQPLVNEHRLSPFAVVSRYTEMDKLFTSQQLPATGIPVLDQVRKSSGDYNFNSQQLIAINHYYTADAVEVIRAFPFSYVVGLVISNRLFFSPSSMNLYFSKKNRQAALPLERIFNPLLYGAAPVHGLMRQPNLGFQERRGYLEVNTSVPLIALWWLMLGYGYYQARKGILAADEQLEPRAIVIGFIVVTALYVYVVGTGLELGENYRYRYLIEPLMFALTAAAITDLVRKVRQRLSAAAARAGVRTGNRSTR
jgi:hypothetical protein